MYKLVVLSSVLALVAAKPSGLGALGLGPLGIPGLGLGAPWGLGAHLGGPLVTPALAAPLLAGPIAHGPAVGIAGPVVVPAPLGGAAVNYRGPLSLAPGQPASIIAQDGRPLDTLSVNADRAVHLTARAVDQATGAVVGIGAHGSLLGAHGSLLGAHGSLLGAHGSLLGAHGHLLGKRSAPLLGAPWGLPAAHALAPAALALPAGAHIGLRAPIAPLGLGHAGLLGPHW